jgi:hypothetical protein
MTDASFLPSSRVASSFAVVLLCEQILEFERVHYKPAFDVVYLSSKIGDCKQGMSNSQARLVVAGADDLFHSPCQLVRRLERPRQEEEDG